MAGFTKALPVGLIPEQLHVALVRNNVIHFLGWGNQVQLVTGHTQRVQPKVLLTCFAPGTGVTPLVGSATVGINCLLICLFVHLTKSI